MVGQAAIQGNPQGVDGLTDIMRKVLTNKDLRKMMVRARFKQAYKFSWERAAQETLKVYQEAEGRLRSYKARRHFSQLTLSFSGGGRAVKPKEG
mgnify:CR=1 FL=1